MNKLDLQTPDFVAENAARLAELFPNCVTETKQSDGTLKRTIDFDLLRQELSHDIVEGPQERYRLDWPGKREALALANSPIRKTLRPCKEESVNFETTQNLYIEGDNLDALKLLQETYLGEVKMIYIDPPYNTGNDFIYDDNFSISGEEHDLLSGTRDEEGNAMFQEEKWKQNSTASGRFHSEWLSMMYPRLKLAKNLLSENGVIFMSIDDCEQANLVRLGEEVFGESNHLGTIVWKNVTDNNPTNIAIEHEYIVVFAKSRQSLERVWKSSISESKDLLVAKGNELNEVFNDPEELQENYSKWFRENKEQLWPLENYKFIDKTGVYSGERGVHNPGKEGYRYDIIHPQTGKPCKEPLMGYRFPKETMDKMISEGRIIFGDTEDKLVEIKVYAKDYKQKLSSLINLDGRAGANELKDIFPEVTKVFTNPKTTKLLEELISFVTTDGDIIVDFFSGSGSTLHAVSKLNAKDGAKRRVIAVQLPEPNFDIVDGKKVAKSGTSGLAYKAGYQTIADIGKERIRRVGVKIRKDLESQLEGKLPGLEDYQLIKHRLDRLDTGFRVLKIDSSNMADVYYQPDEITQDGLALQVDNLKQDRKPEDLLFQVLLDWGVDLALPINEETILKHRVFFVADNALAACFDTGLDEDFVKELAKRQPLRAVFRDSGYASDAVKINFEQIFKALSPHTEIKTL